jgi:N-acetylglucosamine kinase-like BadF-type ATPase
MDSGNTKTAVVAVALDGRLVAHHRAGAANYQSIGRERALAVMLDAAMPVAAEAAAQGLALAAFGFGLTGLDRPRDREVLDGMTSELVVRLAAAMPLIAAPGRVLLNDACLVLRAGTDDDVGIAASSGTGGNCVGRNASGRRIQVGGLASELGDGGGAHDIAIEGLKAAGRARDGRGWRTSIADKVVGLLGLGSIEDIMDFAIPGNAPEGHDDTSPLQAGMLAPLVFEAAAEGDLVAIEVLLKVGRHLGLSARRAGAMLFSRDDAFPLVLGGSVLMNNPVSAFARAIVAETQTEFPECRPVVLEHHPVAGAALLALDEVASGPEAGVIGPGLRDGTLRRRIGAQVTGLF